MFPTKIKFFFCDSRQMTVDVPPVAVNSYASEDIRQDLMEYITVITKYQCTKCKKVFSLMKDITYHVETEHLARFFCDLCPVELSNKVELLKHKESHKDLPPFQCEICSKRCKTNQALQSHRNSHERKKETKSKMHECTECFERFSDIKLLRNHLATHKDVFPYRCDVCHKVFTEKKNLKKHKRIHSEVKPFRCTQCEYSCRTPSDLNKHKVVHSTLRPYKCKICKVSFKRKSDRNKHQLLHRKNGNDWTTIKTPKAQSGASNQTSLECEYCNEIFTTKKLLDEHKVLVHNGSDSYEDPEETAEKVEDDDDTDWHSALLGF